MVRVTRLFDALRHAVGNLRASRDVSHSTFGVQPSNPRQVAHALRKMRCPDCGGELSQDVVSDESILYSCINPECGSKIEILDDIDERRNEK